MSYKKVPLLLLSAGKRGQEVEEEEEEKVVLPPFGKASGYIGNSSGTGGELGKIYSLAAIQVSAFRWRQIWGRSQKLANKVVRSLFRGTACEGEDEEIHGTKTQFVFQLWGKPQQHRHPF